MTHWSLSNFPPSHTNGGAAASGTLNVRWSGIEDEFVMEREDGEHDECQRVYGAMGGRR
ncbi:hypothetical protein M413DRAFT_448759 [Hebeloma cylindrosporum]|uniref:Uncharacterized protein n=1 Tax=Hebeloma cylindrosporum TaxID=76867 RepID=A0A0C3BYB6_HEBCY|nr:hypothetical protein M413DRAFT_448759 [Hebeloma cylindrosporum h7]